jgi:hypothetical protein
MNLIRYTQALIQFSRPDPAQIKNTKIRTRGDSSGSPDGNVCEWMRIRPECKLFLLGFFANLLIKDTIFRQERERDFSQHTCARDHLSASAGEFYFCTVHVAFWQM